MYKEVAFDPKCLAEYHYYGLLKASFGFEKGCYVIANPSTWVKEAFLSVKASQSLQDNKKKSITNYLHKLKKDKKSEHIILPKARTDESPQLWESWVDLQHAVTPFCAVVSESYPNSITYDDILENQDVLFIPPTIQVTKSAHEIVAGIEVLIRLGGNVTLVDQYFILANNPVLDLLLALVTQFNSVRSIRLVTSINTKKPQQVFHHEYGTKYPCLPRFEMIVAPERYFHDRYLISEFGCIKAGHGFSQAMIKGTPADLLSLGLCSIIESKSVLDNIEQLLINQKAERLLLNEPQEVNTSGY